MKIPSLLSGLLLLLVGTSFSPASQVIISEFMYNAAGTKAEWIEVTNLSTNRLDMAKWELASGATLTLPDFNAGASTAHLFLEKERILLSSKSPADTRLDYPTIPLTTRIFGPWTGLLDNGGETITLKDKNGAKLCELSYADGGRFWPTAPDGTGHSLVVVAENKTINDPSNWRTSTAQGGTPGAPDSVPSEVAVGDPTASLPLTYTEAVNMTATWNYYRETAAPPTDWNALNFVPAAPWGSGPALLGHETTPLVLPAPGLITAVQNATLLTYYFRTNFTWTGGAGGAQFQMDTILDDGATFYLNGTYIGNKDAVVSVIHNSSVATTTVTDGALVTNSVIGTIPPGLLQEGNNVLAAVGLQVSTTSSDMIFGANLRLANFPAAELLINEVRQAGPGAGFIEFFNPTASAINLQGYYLTDTSGVWTKFPITQSLVVNPGGLATLGLTEMGFSSTATTTTIYLSKPNGTPLTGLIATLPQDGRSLGRRPSGSSSWYRFSQPTPGSHAAAIINTSTAAVYPSLNEVHFDSLTGRADWVEFTNASTSAQSFNGLFVASTKNFSDKVALSGSLAVGAYASANVDFEVSSSGNLTLFLIDGANTVLGEAEVERKPGKTGSQVWPRGGSEWYATATPTQNAVNTPDRNTAIVISEIMYAPPSDHRQGEFIELTNRSASAVNLGGWRFSQGVSYTLPANTSIAPGGRLVVAQNAAFITANYPGATAVVGDYGGSLSNSGELIRLLDETGNLADEVDYKSGGDWPRQADSLGSSLELINAAMDNDAGSSWAASDETTKGQWTNFTYTGLWHNQGAGGTDAERRELHFELVGDSHLVLRNLTFGQQGSGASALTTGLSPLNSGTDGWRVTGTHWASFSDAEGLHIVADGGGDLKGNAVELDVPAINQTTVPYTINFQARWVTGMSRLVMNTWDRTWGRTFAVPVPNALGTPGTANSRASALAGPEIWSMLHSPVIPKAIDDVKLTARVTSALPLASVNAVHRLDSVAGTNAWTTSPMNDAGTGGDATAGDGIYTVTLTNYKTDGAIAQFYIQASATGGGTTTYPAGGVLTPGMWIVDNSPVTSDLLVQRFVMSQRDHDGMGGNGVTAAFNYRFPRMSNRYYNTTLILNEKEIVYNVESRKSGSPFTRLGDNSMDRVRTKFPKDRLFRGREKTGADNDAADAGARRWNNRVNRYWLYLLNYPAAEAEFVQVQFNNLGLSLKDDTEPTDTDMLDRTYENSGSTELHEIDDSWYFGDDLGSEPRNNTDGNWVMDARWLDSPVYWMGSWPIRTQSERYDYSALTTLIRTMYNNNVTPVNDSADDNTYRASVESVLDVDKFARYAAIRAWAGSWDNFTINRGKNGYIYRRSTDGLWEFEFWDGDLDFQNTGEGVLGGIGGTAPFFTRPWMRRSLNFYLQEIRDQWSLNSPRMYAWLQAMEDQSPSYDINQPFYKTWFSNRRGTIDTFIGAANQTVALSAVASVGANTTLNFTNLTGNAPTAAASITVDGHPEGAFRWNSESTWQILNLVLRSGTNTFTVRSWDRFGNALATTSVVVTKTGDAPPVLAITSTPDSLNTALGEALVVDGASSFDPEGTIVNLAWSIAPTGGVTNTASGLTGRRFVFTVPGIYTLTLNGTDGAGSISSLSRQVTVFAANDFSSFGSSLLLSPNLTATNTELRDNSSPSSWYSLEDTSGRLELHINESAAAPVDSGNFPTITRTLPISSNWALQTDVSLDTRHLGEYFNAGLLVDVMEGANAVRYLYGYETGDQIRVRRDDAATAYNPGGPSAPTPTRINCGGPTVTEADALTWLADTHFLTTPATAVTTQVYAPTSGTNLNYAAIGDDRRTGVAGGDITYEIPVETWSYNYNVALYSSVVASAAISMGVTINDVAAGTFTANSSATIMRVLTLPNIGRNPNGKIKITLSRNASTTAGFEAGLSAIQITPVPAPAPPGGALPNIPPAPMASDALRIQRVGDTLVFARQANGIWLVDKTQSIPTGTTVVRGGIFASTETAMNLRAVFDYLIVADPSQVASLLGSLRLTEVMYNPAGSGVEYLEFQNTGTAPLNLQGVNLPAGSPVAAYAFGNESLGAGEFIVLTGNPAGFRAKYGVSPRLALAPWTSGAIDNGGERILINDPAANNIHDFIYDDISPWPTTPDGQGPSLEIIDYNGDYTDPLNWRASLSGEGTPGGLTRLTDPDTDADGIPDWVENAFGLASNSPGQTPAATFTSPGGALTVNWPFLANKDYRIETSSDLNQWDPLATVTGTGTYTDPSLNDPNRRFLRVVALPYP
jgi:hypothetical protein